MARFSRQSLTLYHQAITRIKQIAKLSRSGGLPIMVLTPLLCVVASVLLITIRAAPMHNQAASGRRSSGEYNAEHHSPYHTSTAVHAGAGDSSSTAKEEIAPINHIHPDDTKDVWKTGSSWSFDKSTSDYALKSSKAMLGNAVLKKKRPDLDSEIEENQGRLKYVHGKMKGWHEYFTSEQGKKQADTEGRRAISAQHKAVITGKYHDLTDVLKPNEKKRTWREAFKSIDKDKEWQEAAKSIPGRIEEIEKDYGAASDHKRAHHRHRYGLFQIHVADGNHPDDFPFETSQQAHKRIKKEKEERKKERRNSRPV